MIHWDFAVNFFVALFALLDPVGNVPVFAASTVGASGRERAQIAFFISLFVLGFLTFFYFSGLGLLTFFGISLPAFRIAGGVLIGPGAISTVIIYASQAKQYGLPGAALGIGAIAAVSVATLLSFLATPLIGRILGKIGLSIIVRVLGLILCAMAVQFLLAGIADSTHGLIRPEAAAPYAK